MAPSAPITLTPGFPAPAFGSGDQIDLPVNGLSPGSTDRVPGKSNVKLAPAIPSPSHSGHGSSTLEGKDAIFVDSLGGGGKCGQGDGERVTKVQWVDNHGKDLTQVFEFEPSSDSDGSEDYDDDSDSAQACTCVIQ